MIRLNKIWQHRGGQKHKEVSRRGRDPGAGPWVAIGYGAGVSAKCDRQGGRGTGGISLTHRFLSFNSVHH